MYSHSEKTYENDAKWVNKIKQYEIEVQITKLARGQGLAELMANANQ